MRYEIVLAPEAVQDLKRLRANLRTTVKEAITTHLGHEPTKVSRSRIKRLRGLSRPQFRLRIDPVRVFYDVAQKRVQVLAIVSKEDSVQWLHKIGRKS